MLTVYLSSPGSQMHADHVSGMPVLLSYAVYSRKDGGVPKWIEDYAPSFGRVLIDSGAFSEFNTGKKIDRNAYSDWAQRWHMADAVAALDDIRGDWERGLTNWIEQPGSFPTYHDSDPEEALDEILKRKPTWLGLGMVPPRKSAHWLKATLERLSQPEHRHIHVHGWALRAYTQYSRINSVDSTNWFRDAQQILTNRLTQHLTPAEALQIVVKRYQRESRKVLRDNSEGQRMLFDD